MAAPDLLPPVYNTVSDELYWSGWRISAVFPPPSSGHKNECRAWINSRHSFRTRQKAAGAPRVHEPGQGFCAPRRPHSYRIPGDASVPGLQCHTALCATVLATVGGRLSQVGCSGGSQAPLGKTGNLNSMCSRGVAGSPPGDTASLSGTGLGRKLVPVWKLGLWVCWNQAPTSWRLVLNLYSLCRLSRTIVVWALIPAGSRCTVIGQLS